MTLEQKDIFNEYISRGYNSDRSRQNTFHVTIYDPAKETDFKHLEHRDKWAADDITRLEEQIEMLKLYRLAIAERYAELMTEPTTPVIELKREKNYYSGKVFYYIIVSRKYVNTGELSMVSSSQYPGTERRQAMQDFANYVKDHPGIEAIKNIEKGRWEK